MNIDICPWNYQLDQNDIFHKRQFPIRPTLSSSLPIRVKTQPSLTKNNIKNVQSKHKLKIKANLINIKQKIYNQNHHNKFNNDYSNNLFGHKMSLLQRQKYKQLINSSKKIYKKDKEFQQSQNFINDKSNIQSQIFSSKNLIEPYKYYNPNNQNNLLNSMQNFSEILHSSRSLYTRQSVANTNNNQIQKRPLTSHPKSQSVKSQNKLKRQYSRPLTANKNKDKQQDKIKNNSNNKKDNPSTQVLINQKMALLIQMIRNSKHNSEKIDNHYRKNNPTFQQQNNIETKLNANSVRKNISSKILISNTKQNLNKKMGSYVYFNRQFDGQNLS